MGETIKKEEWEDFLSHWHKLDHPVVPGEPSIAIFRKLIKKHVKGRKALLLGATWQLRDLLAELGFHVTVVDVSHMILKAHNHMCKVKDRDEEIVESDWLSYKSEEKFDLVIGDACNFQFPEEKQDEFFRKTAEWLNQDGVSIQLLMAEFNGKLIPLKDVVDFVKNADEKDLKDHINKARYYLGYQLFRHGNDYGDLADVINDLKPFIEKGEISQERVDIFTLGVNKFMAQLIPGKKFEEYIKKHLEIVEKVPHGHTDVEEGYYWQYVMRRKE